jgi:hypothetical protein
MAMNKATINLLLMVPVLLVGISCGERDEDFLPDISLLPERGALDKHLVYVDQANDKAYMIDVVSADPEPRASAVELPRNPLLLQRRNGDRAGAGGHHDELLVLCRGQEETEEEEEQAPSLAVLNGEGEVRTYWLRSCFNTLRQSADGRYAFLFYDERAADAGLCSGPMLTQHVTLIDLQSEPGKEAQPYIELVAWDSSVPRSVFFSPEMSVAELGGSRRFAVVLTDTLVWFLDLSGSGSGRVAFEPLIGKTTKPSRVVFNPDQSQIYILAENSDDIYIMDLSASLEGGGGNDFEIKDTARAAGVDPSDLEVYSDGELSRLLVVASGSQEAVVIDPDTSVEGGTGTGESGADDSSSWPVRVPLEAAADRILFFRGGDVGEPDSDEPRALLYAGNSTAVAFLDLSDIEVNRQRNLQTVSLNRPYERIIRWDDDTVVLVSEGYGLSLLDLEKRTITGIEVDASLRLIPDSAVHKLWLAPSGDKRLRYLEVGTSGAGDELFAGDVLLDYGIDALIPLTSGERKRVVVEHPSEVGFITILDAEQPEIDTAVSLKGFFLADVLDDRGES